MAVQDNARTEWDEMRGYPFAKAVARSHSVPGIGARRRPSDAPPRATRSDEPIPTPRWDPYTVQPRLGRGQRRKLDHPLDVDCDASRGLSQHRRRLLPHHDGSGYRLDRRDPRGIGYSEPRPDRPVRMLAPPVRRESPVRSHRNEAQSSWRLRRESFSKDGPFAVARRPRAPRSATRAPKRPSRR